MKPTFVLTGYVSQNMIVFLFDRDDSGTKKLPLEKSSFQSWDTNYYILIMLCVFFSSIDQLV